MYQTIIIAGNVGRDPEMRYTPSGQAVTSFSVATNRQYNNNNGETVKETIWFRISAWGKTGEICNQLVEGRLTADPATGGPRVWTAQDGSTRASFEVYAQTVRFLSSRSESTEPGLGAAPAGEESPAPAADEGDIPF